MADEVFPNGNRRDQRRRVDVAPQRDPLPSKFENLLTEEEIEEIRIEAKATILAEQKKRQRDSLFASFLDEERKQHDPKKILIPLFLQLAGHADYIMLDGCQYHHNSVVNVTADVYAVLVEQMNRGWAHEEVTEVRDFKSRRRFRPPPGIGYFNFLGERAPRELVLSSSQLAGAVDTLRQTVAGPPRA